MKKFIIQICLIGIFMGFSFAETLIAQPCSVSITPVTPTICAGGSVTLLATPSWTTIGTVTYSWSPAAGLSATNIANPVASPAVTTTYTVTITDLSGCSGTNQTVTVVVSPLPSSVFTYTLIGWECGGRYKFIAANSSYAPTAYAWNFNDGSSTVSGAEVIHRLNAFGAGSQSFNVTLTVTLPNGCTSNSTQSLIVTQRPDASLFNNDIPQFTQCTAPPMPYFCTVTNTTTTAATNVFYRINWDTLSNPTPFTSNNSWSSQVYTYPTGYSFLQYIVQGINGCVDTARYSVFNGQNPSLGLNSLGSTNGCTNGTSCFSFSVFGSSPDLTYIVDWDDGTIEHYGGINPPLPDPLTHCYTTSSCSKPGAGYFLKVTATNPCSYSQSTYGPIHISAPPSSQFIDPWLHCPNQPLTFINTSETGCYITGGVAYYKANFRWIIDNVIISEVFNTSVPPNLTISLSSGQHNVCLESWNQCNGSGDHSIECHTICVDPQPQASFSLPAPAEGCKPYTVTVTNTSSDINSPLDNPCNTLQYTWTVTNIIGSPNCLPQASAISWSFALGSDLHSQHPTFIFNDAGSYQINLTVQNGCGSQTISHTVTVNQPPNVSINASSLGSTCPGEPLFPTATVDNCWGTAAYNWLFPEGTPINSSLPNPVVTYSTPGVKLITLEVGNSCGIGTDTKSAFVQASPVPTINGEDAVCLGQYYIYTTEPGMSNYLWNLMGGITLGGTTSNSISVIWVGPAAIISVSYSNGCNAPTSTSMIVDIFPPLMGDVFLSDTIIGNGQTACFAHQKITTGSVNEPFTVQTGGMANLFGSDWVKLWPGTVVHQGGRLTVSIANNCIPCSIFQTFSGNQPYNQDNNENITVSSLMPAQFLRLYPNPTSGKFMIEMKNDGENLATQIRIFNMMGNVVFEQSIREGIFKQELSLDNQAPGIYYVKVIRGDESTILKLVKTR